MANLLNELKRRNVIRVVIAYVITAWLLLQVADVILNNIGAPRWVFQSIMLLLAIGFPIVLTFSWVYEVTPEGLKKEADVDRSKSITAATGRKLDFVIFGLMAMGLLYFAWDKFLATPVGDDAHVAVAPEVTGKSDNSIAVLPFVNMSDDPGNEYFSDGLSEELLNALVRGGGLKVTGRTSSFAFRDQNTDLREIGRLLNVANVLEGSVRKYENRVRITAQLVKTADGYHIWSETFDRELDDIFAIQQEIASRVTGALHVALMGPGGKESPVNPSPARNAQAYEEYLRGMYVFQQGLDDKDGLTNARQHFARALELDPDYVDGHSGMFKTWDRWHRNAHGPFEESADRIAFYAAKLEQLAPGSEQAIIANARSATIQWEIRRAYEILEKAAEQYPGSSAILARYGVQAALVGGYEKGLTALRDAIRLDPLSLEYLSFMASLQHRAGDCAGAQETLNRALELNSRAGRVRYHEAMCVFETTGNAAQALAIASGEPLGFMYGTAMAILLHRLGDRDSAQQQFDYMIKTYGDSAAYQYGQVYAQWGDAGKALAWLETALDVRDPGLLQARTDALLDPLRGEPRFVRVLESAGGAD